MKIRIKDKVGRYLWYKSLEGTEIEVCSRTENGFYKISAKTSHLKGRFIAIKDAEKVLGSAPATSRPICRGMRFKRSNSNLEYMLANVDTKKVCLVSLLDGNRWSAPIKVGNVCSLTELEIKRVFTDDFVFMNGKPVIKSSKVKLGTYTAVIKEDLSVEVGCQKFAKGEIDEFIKVYQEASK